MAGFPRPEAGIVLTHFIVAADVDRSRRFYAGILGGEVLLDGEPTIVALGNSWVIINVGGPPTERSARRPRSQPGIAQLKPRVRASRTGPLGTLRG